MCLGRFLVVIIEVWVRKLGRYSGFLFVLGVLFFGFFLVVYLSIRYFFFLCRRFAVDVSFYRFVLFSNFLLFEFSLCLFFLVCRF